VQDVPIILMMDVFGWTNLSKIRYESLGRIGGYVWRRFVVLLGLDLLPDSWTTWARKFPLHGRIPESGPDQVRISGSLEPSGHAPMAVIKAIGGELSC